MLHSYSFKNFQSFAERTEVSLALNEKTPLYGWQARSPGGSRLNLALGVMGANGAGKTIALKPLVFAAWFLRWSFDAAPDSGIPLETHFSNGEDEPAEIEVDAEDASGVLWRYVLHATASRVVHEALYRKRERFNYVFTRDLDGAGGYTIKQQGFGLASGEAAKVRPNASLIATARQYGVETAQHITNFHVASNVDLHGRTTFAAAQLTQAAEVFASQPALRDQMIGLLKSWDLGLAGVVLQQMEQTRIDAQAATKVWMPFGTHEARDGSIHGLHFARESSGTQTAFVLLSRLLPVLAQGGVGVIDEMDADLHAHMIEPVLDLFANRATNPHNAQLIFSAHAPQVLAILQKAQVLFVEKRDCESSAYRADTIRGLRADDNLFAKYMAGALGAVPQV